MSGAVAAYERRLAWMLNVAVPGAGLALLGAYLPAVALCAGFATVAHLAWSGIAAPPRGGVTGATWMLVSICAGFWLLAQAALASVAARSRREAELAARRSVLAAVDRLLAQDAAAARTALEPLLPALDRDLVVAVRYARVMSAGAGGAPARAAWERVRRLDRDRLYPDEVAAALDGKTQVSGGPARDRG